MTIDRRLRSGDAPDGTLLAVWLLTAACIVAAAFVWYSPAMPRGTGPLLLSTLAACGTLAAAMLGLSRTAWRLLGREAAVATCFLLPLNPLVLFAFLPVPNQTAAWHLAATALAVWSLSGRQAGTGAALAGAMVAAGCAIDAALWPLALAMAVLLFVRWLRDHRAAGEFLAFVKGFAAVSLPVLLAEATMSAGFGCSNPRIATVGAIAIVLAGSAGLARIPRLAPVVLAGGMALIAGAALALAILPPFSCGASVLPPFSFQGGLPAGFPTVALLPVIAGLGASLYLMLSNQAWVRRWWGEYSWLLIAATTGSLLEPRMLTVAAGLAAMPLGWLVAQILFTLRRSKGRGRGRRSTTI